MEDEVVVAPPRVDLTKCGRDPEIRQSELYCSKLISQRGGTSFATRYEKSPLYLRILRYCFGEDVQPNAAGEYPRPTKSPFPCFNCHYTFDTPPFFLPTVHLDGRREEGKNFCSGPCAKRYILTRVCDSSQAGMVADLHEYLQDVYGIVNTERIGIAPDAEMREDYGGTMSEARFKAAIHNPNLLVTALTKPFIPTEVVIENQFTVLHPTLAPSAEPANPPAPPPVPTADAGLAAAMGRPAPQTKMHKQWKVQGLQQPSLEEIEARLASLPKLQKRKGLYEVYLQRKGQLGVDDEEVPGVHPVPNPVPNPVSTGPTDADDGTPAPVVTAPTIVKKRSHKAAHPTPPETATATATPSSEVSGALGGFLKKAKR